MTEIAPSDQILGMSIDWLWLQVKQFETEERKELCRDSRDGHTWGRHLNTMSVSGRQYFSMAADHVLMRDLKTTAEGSSVWETTTRLYPDAGLLTSFSDWRTQDSNPHR